MKAIWFMPFAFAAGAEGFALFAPYLVLVLGALHLARTRRQTRHAAVKRRTASRPPAPDLLPDVQPAM